jgi:hypothetical protein
MPLLSKNLYYSDTQHCDEHSTTIINHYGMTFYDTQRHNLSEQTSNEWQEDKKKRDNIKKERQKQAKIGLMTPFKLTSSWSTGIHHTVISRQSKN